MALVGVPATASATLTVSYAPTTGALIQGDAASDGATVALTGDFRIRVTPFALFGSEIPAATLVAGQGCSMENDAVECAASSGSRVSTARLGGDDDVFLDAGYGGDLFVAGQDGNDVLSGGNGFDLIEGGAGDDRLDGGAGNDQVKGGPGDDRFTGDQGDDVGGNGTDTILGEDGNDRLVARNDGVGQVPPSADLFNGGAGTDVADYSARQTMVALKVTVGGTGQNDDGASGEGDGLDSVETLIGGSGGSFGVSSGDVLEFRTASRSLVSGTRTLIGNRGNDSLRVVGGIRTSIDGGLGSDSVTGGSASDMIFSKEGEGDTIRCGGAIDTLEPDLRDAGSANVVGSFPDCENLDQGDRREDPNVVFRNRSVAVDEHGVLAVRLACPRSVRIGCKGKLAARSDRRGTRFGARKRYSIRRGRSAVVKVRLRVGQVAGARRRGARVRVRSVERGVRGPKTTQRTLPTRRR